MSLVKTKSLNGNGTGVSAGTDLLKPTSTTSTRPNNSNAEQLRRKARTLAKQQQAAERLASATVEMSQGVQEASAASEELRADRESVV